MARKRYYLKIVLDGDVAEDRPEAALLSPRSRIWFRDLVELLQAAREQKRVACVWLVVKSNGLDWNQIEELHRQLDLLKAAGKATVVSLEHCGNRDFYLACGFEKIYLAPLSGLGLIGLRSELLFFSDVLEWAGVKPQLIQIGKFKSAAEIFTRTGFSDASREMLESILQDLQGQLVDRISSQRNLEPAQVQDLIDGGPYTSAAAVEAGLVDGIRYEDELENQIEELGLRRVAVRKVLKREGLLRRLATFRRPQIAYIVVEGIIKSGRSTRTPGRGSAGAETVRAALQKARKAKRVAAVVLRVNSPGGSALASDMIWREVWLTDQEKPVIVSMGSEAASGGYYLAVAGRFLYAMPGSLTGSIGVLGGKFSLGRLLRGLRVSTDSIEKGAHAGISSMTRDFDPQEEARLTDLSADVYHRFLDKVAEGRNLDSEKVATLAQGRVWTGRQALENGLVDGLGGLLDALETARREAQLEGRRVRIIHYRERRGLRGWLPFPLLEALSSTRVWALNPFRWKFY